MPEHIIANRITENDPTENPLESLRAALAFSSNEWAESRAGAWVWGIVLGWDDEDEPDSDAMAEVAARYRWAPEVVARLRRLHEAFNRLGGDAAAVSEISDGYHTISELYRYRMLYNAALFNEWARDGRYEVHKSQRHADGELCFGGSWFVVYAALPTGQISNHYPMADWDLFQVPEHTRAAEWDGHTPQDVDNRLARFLQGADRA